jgi:hypothetical protein
MAKYFTLTLSLAILFFAACNKPATESADSKQDLLRKSIWKISSGTLTVKLPNGKDTVLDYMHWIPACHRDDYFKFNSTLYGAVFNGDIKCDPSEADSISLAYRLSNNNQYLSLYNSFHLYYSVGESVLPYRFDTLQFTPLVLDTVYGAADTPGLNAVIRLDTIWMLHFDTVAVANTDIFNAPITNFTQNSFTINFSLISDRPDSTNFKTGKYYFTNVGGFPDSADNNTVRVPDTFKYKVTYSNY